MTVRIAIDRSLCVKVDQIVKTSWIDIDVCVLGSRVRMAPEAVKEKYEMLINIGDGMAAWPPVIGHWDGKRFVVCDGRHEYLAALMVGREKIFVAWLEGFDS